MTRIENCQPCVFCINENGKFTEFSQKISTHLLTVLTTYVILHAEQRKQHISPVGEIFLI